MPYKRKYNIKRKPNYKRRFNTRGPGRGYKAGYNRFGRIANPELKHKTLTRAGAMAPDSVQEMTVWPAIEQGIQDDQRIGNRIAGKFLNVRLVFQSRRPDAATLPQNCPVIRYVLWMNKDPTSNAAGTLPDLDLVEFLNTKQIRILKHGFITLSLAGTAKVLTLNNNLHNRTIDFIANTDLTANTSQRIYLSVYSTQVVDWQLQSRFYFADP